MFIVEAKPASPLEPGSSALGKVAIYVPVFSKEVIGVARERDAHR